MNEISIHREKMQVAFFEKIFFEEVNSSSIDKMKETKECDVGTYRGGEM